MNCELHNKFKGGVIRDNADSLEARGSIQDLLSPRIRLKSKYVKRVHAAGYAVKVHDCQMPQLNENMLTCRTVESILTESISATEDEDYFHEKPKKLPKTTKKVKVKVHKS